jgi:hypothetical protein
MANPLIDSTTLQYEHGAGRVGNHGHAAFADFGRRLHHDPAAQRLRPHGCRCRILDPEIRQPYGFPFRRGILEDAGAILSGSSQKSILAAAPLDPAHVVTDDGTIEIRRCARVVRQQFRPDRPSRRCCRPDVLKRLPTTLYRELDTVLPWHWAPQAT